MIALSRPALWHTGFPPRLLNPGCCAVLPCPARAVCFCSRPQSDWLHPPTCWVGLQITRAAWEMDSGVGQQGCWPRDWKPPTFLTSSKSSSNLGTGCVVPQPPSRKKYFFFFQLGSTGVPTFQAHQYGSPPPSPVPTFLPFWNSGPSFDSKSRSIHTPYLGLQEYNQRQ